MAEFKTLTEARSYQLTTGATADLIALIGTSTTDGLTSVSDPAEMTVGDVAYVYAMGNLRRGVVTKLTRTKIHVTFTTQGAVDSARAFETHTGYTNQPIRIQTTAAAAVYVKKAPAAPAPVEIEEAPEADLVPLTVDVEGLTAQLRTEAEEEAEECADCAGEVAETGSAQELTLNSHGGKVGLNSENNTEENAMTAKGKINASKVQINDRIIVKVSADGTVRPSDTKTGEGVQVARVTDKGMRAAGQYEARGKYIVETSAGSFEAAPIQTMWLAPEDAAGVKRAHVEAQAEDNDRAVAQAKKELEEVAEEIKAADEAKLIGTVTFQRLTEIHDAARICTRRSFSQPAMGHLALSHLADIRAELAQARQEDPEAPAAPVEIDQPEELTLNSHGGKVGLNSENETEEPDMTSTDTQTAIVRELTGSSVVRLLERVHQRIRQNHPEVPEVVIVTGAGIGFGAGKWGHFRPQGWTTRTEGDQATHIHEMFMAGETLAKGSRQVLQTMIHESAHALAEHRGEKDTSRQGRWHNQVFRKTAEELGLEYKGQKADKTLGFSQVTLTAETVEEYKDLLDELDAEIHLMVRLPGWLGGTAGSDGEDGEDEGGENMGKAPKTGPATNSNNAKLTCECDEPNIIRASKKVAAKMVVRCDDCEALFAERD